MSYLFNFYKYIYYNFCIYKNDDNDNNNDNNDNNNNDDNNDNHNINKKSGNNLNLDLDKLIISSLVCNNIEIPFYEIKTFNSEYMKR